MKINYSKARYALNDFEKLPRKIKKYFLGLRMSSGKLNRLLKQVEVIEGAKTMYDSPVIKPYLFCPKCGCRSFTGTGNKTSYPEHWEYFHCHRCRNMVAYIDNSPFTHVLEYDNFEII